MPTMEINLNFVDWKKGVNQSFLYVPNMSEQIVFEKIELVGFISYKRLFI